MRAEASDFTHVGVVFEANAGERADEGVVGRHDVRVGASRASFRLKFNKLQIGAYASTAGEMGTALLDETTAHTVEMCGAEHGDDGVSLGNALARVGDAPCQYLVSIAQ